MTQDRSLSCKLAPLMTILQHRVSSIRFAAADGEDRSIGHDSYRVRHGLRMAFIQVFPLEDTGGALVVGGPIGNHHSCLYTNRLVMIPGSVGSVCAVT